MTVDASIQYGDSLRVTSGSTTNVQLPYVDSDRYTVTKVSKSFATTSNNAEIAFTTSAESSDKSVYVTYAACMYSQKKVIRCSSQTSTHCISQGDLKTG